MSKDSFWFRHDSNARNDPKLAKLLFIGGHAAKSCFWDLIEIMREADGYKIEKGNLEAISFQCRFPADKNVVGMMIDCDLLCEDGKYIWSASLVRRMEEWDTKKELLSKAGKKGAKAKARNKRNNSTPSNAKATLKPPLSQAKTTLKPGSSQAQAIREEKIREEKIREEKITSLAVRETKSTIDQEFERFYAAYPKKKARKNAEKAFTKARKDKNWPGIDRVITAIEEQRGCENWKKDSGQFIPHPASWLNAGSWGDDVSKKKPGGTFMENLREAARLEREGIARLEAGEQGVIDVDFE